MPTEVVPGGAVTPHTPCRYGPARGGVKVVEMKLSTNKMFLLKEVKWQKPQVKGRLVEEGCTKSKTRGGLT